MWKIQNLRNKISPMYKKLKNFVEFVKNFDGKIGLISHKNPDGDAVGSLLALYLFLKKAGKDVKPILLDKVPDFLDFLPGVKEIESKLEANTFDLLILLDASEFSRTGFSDPPNKLIIRVDHHISGKKYSPYDIIVTESPSTASLIYEIIKRYDYKLIDKEIKTCIYTGLLTDTSSFRHSNSFRWAFRNAYELVNNGLDVTDIASLVYERKKLKTLQLLGHALSGLTILNNAAFIKITSGMLEYYGLDRSETEGFVNYPLSLEEAIVGVSIIEVEKDIWRVSLRGKNRVNLAKVAEAFGGGGHFNAAGCTIKGKDEEVINALIEKIAEFKIK